jgi:type IV pilus assembly protein PilB
MAANTRTIGLSGLARTLVQHERVSDATAKSLTHETLMEAGSAEEVLDGTRQPWSPAGCDHCKGTGYKGRIAIFQVMPVSDEIQRIIMRRGNAIEIAEQAHLEGVRDLRHAGLLNVKQGLASLEEVMAVTNE